MTRWLKRWLLFFFFFKNPLFNWRSGLFLKADETCSHWVIFSSWWVNGCRWAKPWQDTSRLLIHFVSWKGRLTPSEEFSRLQDPWGGETRCCFVPERMVPQLHPHSTCASTSRLSPHPPGVRNNIQPLKMKGESVFVCRGSLEQAEYFEGTATLQICLCKWIKIGDYRC